MVSVAKANAVMRDLADKLAKRLPAGAAGLNTLRQTVDANGWPMLFISHNGSEAEGAPCAVIRIKAVDMVSKDVFGNGLSAYAPHTIELGYELTGAGAPEITAGDKAALDFEVIKTGIRYMLKEIANGTAVTETSLNAAAIVADLEELYWPTKSV